MKCSDVRVINDCVKYELDRGNEVCMTIYVRNYSAGEMLYARYLINTTKDYESLKPTPGEGALALITNYGAGSFLDVINYDNITRICLQSQPRKK